MIVGLPINGDQAPLSPYQALAADFNADGVVSLGDAIGVLRYVVGLPSDQPRWLLLNESDTSIPQINPLAPGNVQTTPPISLSLTDNASLGLVGVLRGDETAATAAKSAAHNWMFTTSIR